MFLSVIWIIAVLVIGFMLGRISMYEQGEPEEGTARKDQTASSPNGKSRPRRTRGHRAEEERKSWSVGSPISGEVSVQREGERPAIVIHPEGDKLYAPVNGKITRLFPMGNAMIFTTEFGVDLYIQAGDVKDDLLGRYYRPRIVQNEIVGKGKLLLEFDRQGLAAEGASADVTVCVENCFYGGDIRLTAGELIKTGEEIVQVRETQLQGVMPDGYVHG